MNRLLNSLHSTMENKIAFYDGFIDLLQREWDSITGYSPNSLREILEEKEKFVVQMGEMEKTRVGLMKQIEHKLGIKKAGLTLKKLLQLHPSQLNKKLARSRGKLLSQIATITTLTQNLKNLMDSSALSMKKSIANIHTVNEASQSPYLSNGRLLEGKLQGRMLSMDV